MGSKNVKMQSVPHTAPVINTTAKSKSVVETSVPEKIVLSKAEWRKKLSPNAFQILRNGGTESPGSHQFIRLFPKSGYFACGGCRLPLYSVESKFRDSGW